MGVQGGGGGGVRRGESRRNCGRLRAGLCVCARARV